MVGPPGSGKTMLARRLPTILPAMSLAEALETTKIHSVAGMLPAGEVLVAGRAVRAPPPRGAGGAPRGGGGGGGGGGGRGDRGAGGALAREAAGAVRAPARRVRQ